jgi:pheromone receptor transcription factor
LLLLLFLLVTMSEASLVDSADLQAAAQVVNAPPGDPSPNIKRDRTLDDDDDDDDRKPGRERRKIEIKFISDKSRRHITFSKRKAGIMKKAYELSVLTGTQVLLLVVSETGLVYTFTTPKLQPLVTKPEGKNLIQACLNAPEDTPQQAPQQQQPQQPQGPQNGHPDPTQQQLHDPMAGLPPHAQGIPDQHHLAQQEQVRQAGLGGNVYAMSPEQAQAAAYNHYLAMPPQQAQQQRYLAPQHPHHQ